MFTSLSCKKSKVSLPSVVLLGVRDSSYLSCITLLSSGYGSLLMVLRGCSDPSHHIRIPAKRKEEEQEGCAIFPKDTPVYMPLARAQAYCYTELSGEAGK